MLIQRLITSGNHRALAAGRSLVHLPLNAASISISSSDENEPAKPERKLRTWKIDPEPEPSFFQMFEPAVKKGKKFVLPRRVVKFAPGEFEKWWGSLRMNYMKEDQAFKIERHETLGCNLAAATFLVHRGGKVKFYGREDWVQRNKDKTYDLPTVWDPMWVLTDIDASGIHLYYEGIENFQNLLQVTWANFSGNDNLDDWCIDHITSQLPNLEYLDISECKRVTERALEAIYRMQSLKTLIITDWYKQPSFELTCSMLLDCCPNLNVEIKEPSGGKDAPLTKA